MEATVTLDFDGNADPHLSCVRRWVDSDGPARRHPHQSGHGAESTTACSGRGSPRREYDFSAGFCVAGEDTAAFLQDALHRLGLTEREADEFIIYWLPKLEGNPYRSCSPSRPRPTPTPPGLTIDPAPDNLHRVFLAWKGRTRRWRWSPRR